MNDDYFSAIHFSPDGLHLMAGLHSGQVKYYDVKRLSVVQEYSTVEGMNIACCTFRNNNFMSLGSKS